ncbi:putative alkaline serine protease AorO [Elsinoe ampelina]|uniref:Putative alkaline serine protease AorO n=1 Tax=Elsinoe ampelina TaxID=302913 RepID=A0A6A6GD93_9PEZI|nr:putative alkaline serine protease AorO [Elsinoe ampelina]
MLFKEVALLTAAIGSALAAPAPSGHVVHERRETSPMAWNKIDRLDKRTILPMRIGLTQSNLDQGHSKLMEVAHHGSAQYGKHWTAEEVTDFFAPSAETVDAVRSWLVSAGISAERIGQSANKQWIQFDAKTEEAEKLLKTEYHAYQHAASGKTNIACDEYHVPKDVQAHIDYITPGIKLTQHSGLPAPTSLLRKRGVGNVRFSRPPLTMPMPASIPTGRFKSLAATDDLSKCSSIVTPACIASLYNFTAGTTATPGNELGIFEDLGDVYSQEDLDAFFTLYYPELPNGTSPILRLIDGAVAPVPPAQAGLESALDFQISYPIINPQNSVLFQTDDPVYENNYIFNGFLNNFFDAIDGSYCSFSAYGETGNSPLDPPYPNPSNATGAYKGELQCGVYEPTNVISISYGGAEADLPISYQRRQCDEIMKLGLRGISVINSSGDSGVEGRGGDPTPSNCLGENQDVFAPQFPATCPYITAVGSTVIQNGTAFVPGNEVPTTRFGSGGGFSNIYGREEQATWQIEAVEGYFAKNLVDYPFYESVDNSSFNEDGGIYNRAGRGYPDVAGLGDKIAIVGNLRPLLIGGTSASAPLFASILVRINEDRIALGKSPVGFVNPVVYAHPEAFNDVTTGSNPGCGTPGFLATQGWDPVSGLGSADYGRLRDVFLGLP